MNYKIIMLGIGFLTSPSFLMHAGKGRARKTTGATHQYASPSYDLKKAYLLLGFDNDSENSLGTKFRKLVDSATPEKENGSFRRKQRERELGWQVLAVVCQIMHDREGARNTTNNVRALHDAIRVITLHRQLEA